MEIKTSQAILYLILLIFFCNCSTPKFYDELNLMQREVQKDINGTTNRVNAITINGIDFNKLILIKLTDKLKSTNHIIYYYCSDTSLSSGKIWVTIYDVDKKKYYSLENQDSNKREIVLTALEERLLDKNTSFIFDTFISNDCKLLKANEEVKISGVRSYEAIYEINLKNMEFRSCYFKNFILFN